LLAKISLFHLVTPSPSCRRRHHTCTTSRARPRGFLLLDLVEAILHLQTCWHPHRRKEIENMMATGGHLPSQPTWQQLAALQPLSIAPTNPSSSSTSSSTPTTSSSTSSTSSTPHQQPHDPAADVVVFSSSGLYVVFANT
jgi:hypothetical protein